MGAYCLAIDLAQTYVRVMGGNWRGFEFAWMRPVPEPDEGPGLTWRQLTPGTGRGPGRRRSGAPSPSTPTAGSRTSGSRTRPASRPSPPSAATTPWRRHRSRRTRCGRRGDLGGWADCSVLSLNPVGLVGETVLGAVRPPRSARCLGELFQALCRVGPGRAGELFLGEADGVGEVGAAEVRTPEVGSDESRSDELCVHQIGALQERPGEVGPVLGCRAPDRLLKVRAMPSCCTSPFRFISASSSLAAYSLSLGRRGIP
jgi:hypothetical protein